MMRSLPLLAIVVVLLHGCADSLAPGDVAGRYALISVRGQSLPLVYPANGDQQQTLLSAEVVLAADGTAETVGRIENRAASGAPTVAEFRIEWEYEIDLARLTLRPTECTRIACAKPVPQTLRIMGDALVGSEQEVYVRVTQ